MGESGILQDLTMIFSGLPDNEATQLARTLTEAINLSLYRNERSVYFDIESPPEGLKEIAVKIKIQPASLSLPWQAYSLSKMGEGVLPVAESRIKAVLATIPNEYRVGMAIPDDFVSPYGGSLIRHMGKIIAGAQEDLLIVSPYWSVAGIKSLSRHLPEEFRVNSARAVVITPYTMDPDCREGCNYFKWMLRSRGFDVQHWTPRALSNGGEPLAHAKVIVSDQKSAYLGSANLSESGLNRSIEIGVHLEGPVAKYLSDWFLSLKPHFELEQEQN